MKLSKVLLRWYKSFNVNYSFPDGSDRQKDLEPTRPWNKWKMSDGRDETFPFIEISVDSDITTVVGANESGKSHLLNAISKVITGKGIPGDPFSNSSEPKPYAQTDLCHYCAPLGKNFDVWPHLGVEFDGLTREEAEAIGRAAGRPDSSTSFKHFTLILTHETTETVARLYVSNNEPIPLDTAKLQEVRKRLPKVLFINSQLAIADEIALADLLAAYGSTVSQKTEFFPSFVAQSAARFLKTLSLTAGHAVPETTVSSLSELKRDLQDSQNNSTTVQLELMLFREVLGITTLTLETLFKLEDQDRGHAESLIAQWNTEIERTLNLSRYWQQDQEFSLLVNYKKGVIYFEIKDKTGATYTFRERSSGLRYFLSYYIQARALESSIQKGDAIILMDEPDSFLSILGQRNLLAIFESLVSVELSKQRTQVLYTTHSPFLINRNFPGRIRLVRKGDGEEGTQFISDVGVRRFEPVRSALGIDLAQTLFMGGTNILLEGPTDQFLISETIRCFSGMPGMQDLLDLNSVVLVSAECASGVEHVLAASTWTDEPIPTAIVVLDDDEGGRAAKARITGKERNCKMLVPEEFVLLISDLLQENGSGRCIVTSEDLVPTALYLEAVCNYCTRWFHSTAEQVSAVKSEYANADFTKEGLVAVTTAVLKKAEIIKGHGYDKLGVLQEVILIVRAQKTETEEIKALKKDILAISRLLRAKIDQSERAEKLRSGKQAVHRIVSDFFVKYKAGTTPYELELVFVRLQREAASFGEDADDLRAALSAGLEELKKMRAADIQTVVGENWNSWKANLERLRRNPLQPDISFSNTAPAKDATSEPRVAPLAPTPAPIQGDAKSAGPTLTPTK